MYTNREPLMSQSEVERKYSNLHIQAAEKNRFNCYVCTNPICGEVTKTIDRHHGVTPMFLSCPSCGLRTSSTGYRDIRPDYEPTYEWAIPSLKQCMKMRREPAMLEHIFMGGLKLSKI